MTRRETTRHSRRGRWLYPAVFAAAILSALLASGCGGPGDASESPPGYLDPPGLSATVAGEMGPGVPVLCYHYFRGRFDPAYALRVLGSVLLGMPALGPREYWTTPVGEFEKHLRYLADHDFRVMTLDEVADLVQAGRQLPDRAVVLTIDDADESVYRYAYPLLKKYGMRAHLFVPTAHVGSRWDELKICSWDQLREMAASGAVVIGSHTRDLHFKVRHEGRWEPVFWHPARVPDASRLAALRAVTEPSPEGPPSPEQKAALAGPLAGVGADLMASRRTIASEIGRAPRWLAWPYGFATDRLDSLSRTMGFRGTVTLAPVAFAATDTALSVGRLTLTAKTTLAQIGRALPAAVR